MVTESPRDSQVPGVEGDESRLETGQRTLKCSRRGTQERTYPMPPNKRGYLNTDRDLEEELASTHANNNRQPLTPRKPESRAGKERGLS